MERTPEILRFVLATLGAAPSAAITVADEGAPEAATSPEMSSVAPRSKAKLRVEASCEAASHYQAVEMEAAAAISPQLSSAEVAPRSKANPRVEESCEAAAASRDRAVEMEAAAAISPQMTSEEVALAPRLKAKLPVEESCRCEAAFHGRTLGMEVAAPTSPQMRSQVAPRSKAKPSVEESCEAASHSRTVMMEAETASSSWRKAEAGAATPFSRQAAVETTVSCKENPVEATWTRARTPSMKKAAVATRLSRSMALERNKKAMQTTVSCEEKPVEATWTSRATASTSDEKKPADNLTGQLMEHLCTAPWSTADGSQDEDKARPARKEHLLDSLLLATVPGSTMVGDDGVAAHNIYNQYQDLFIYGMPLLSFWYQIWKSKPLVLHDKEFISPMEFLRTRGGTRPSRRSRDEHPNFTAEFAAVLSNHLGTIKYFRLDSSTWSDDQLTALMSTLRSRSIDDLTMINIACSTKTVFPLVDMHSVQSLTIGFFSIIPAMGSSSRMCSLKVLKLMCCSFDRYCLYEIVNNHCNVLQELHIGFSVVDIAIRSNSLKVLQIVCSKASQVIVEYAPQLLVLSTSVSATKSKVQLKVDGVLALQELHWIQLTQHQLAEGINSIFKSLRLIHIGINFSDKGHRCRLSQIVETAAVLTTLTVERLDRVGLGELSEMASDHTFTGLKNAHCVKHSLRLLELDSSQGGDAESDLICAIIKGAKSLHRVILVPHKSSCPRTISDSLEEISSAPHASAECRIIFQKEDRGQ
ncbi:uncharacterized protein [Aegilops tauschii subsp. strangulata]|uniref:uncharacterized protein n=1 Tax=Aegilops tauschii subsp. strangulata TaxID=200361 RepID=UPI001ABCCBF7|nr:uncharacterized protein LOC109738940 [Aegilops tauschii subsp. strangulata]XP_044334791.1 uncharacterized protein LOC123054970 [Triticum aestivum]